MLARSKLGLLPNALSWLALLAVLGCGSSSGSDVSGGTTAEPPAPAPTPTPDEPTGETLGFVISQFGYDYPIHATVVCPEGFNLSPGDHARAGTPIEDDCLDPEAHADPSFQALTGAGRTDAFDLDGLVSRADSPVEGECAHDDFRGIREGDGYDFQLWRAIGCIRGQQPGEIADTIVGNSVRDGSSTILIEVTDVDDTSNDASVGVRVYASTEAPPLASDGSILPFGTLTVHEDPSYHGSVGRGSIVDGVLTAGPSDFRWRLNIQIVEADLSLHDAYVRIEFLEDGTARGQFFGYTPADEIYDIFGRKAGVAGAEALGYTCSGLYRALFEQADGDYDPSTGTCSSLSAVYHFDAEPAFVVK